MCCTWSEGARQPVCRNWLTRFSANIFRRSERNYLKPVFWGNPVPHLPLPHPHSGNGLSQNVGEMIGDNLVSAQGVHERAMVCDSIHIEQLSRDSKPSNRICSVDVVYGRAVGEDDLDSAEKRLRWARERAGFRTAKAFAEKARINPVTYRAYENGQIGFANSAAALGKLLGVTGDWLLIGGEVPDGHEIVASQSSAAQAIVDQLDIRMIRQVDISFAMGDGAIVQDYPETGMMPFAQSFLSMLNVRDPESLFVCRGEGDSMAPTIFDADLVMIDTSRQRITMQDRIWALAVAGAGMIKRVRALPTGQILVLSDNPSVPEQVYEGEDVYVVGKVVWIGRRM